MKSIIITIIVVHLIIIENSCLPIQQQPEALVDSYEQTDTGYRFRYEVGDGTIREEIGEYKTDDGKDKPLSVRGYYSYYLDDGQIFDVIYTADENGYRATPNITENGNFESFILRNTLLSLTKG